MTTPQDGYAAVDTVSPPKPPSLPTPPTPPKQSKDSTSSLERFLHGLFLLLILMTPFGFVTWLEIQSMAEVVSRQSIGRFVRMSGAGGLFSDVVIETEVGSYLLHGTPSIAKGTPLVLEVRATGAHYICDESRSLCIETSAKKFKANDAQPAPNAPPSSSTPAQGQTP